MIEAASPEIAGFAVFLPRVGYRLDSDECFILTEKNFLGMDKSHLRKRHSD